MVPSLLSVIMLFGCAITTIGNPRTFTVQSDKIECPDFNETSCTGNRTHEGKHKYECIKHRDCGDHFYKCCSNCKYTYKVCMEVEYIQDSVEYLKNKQCPKKKSCYVPIQYNPKYRCRSDLSCPFGYKCCENGCYSHRVCVLPVDIHGNRIQTPPPPLTTTTTQGNVLNTTPSTGKQTKEDWVGSTTLKILETPPTIKPTELPTSTTTMILSEAATIEDGSGVLFTDAQEDNETESSTLKLEEQTFPGGTNASGGFLTNSTLTTTAVPIKGSPKRLLDPNLTLDASGDGFTSELDLDPFGTATPDGLGSGYFTASEFPDNPYSELTTKEEGSGEGFTDDEDLQTYATFNSTPATASNPIFSATTSNLPKSGSNTEFITSGDGSTDDDDDFSTHITSSTLGLAQTSFSSATFNSDKFDGSGDATTDDEDMSTTLFLNRSTGNWVKIVTEATVATESENGSGISFIDDEDEYTTMLSLNSTKYEGSGSGDEFTSDFSTPETSESSPTYSSLTTRLSTFDGSGSGATTDDEDANTASVSSIHTESPRRFVTITNETTEEFTDGSGMTFIDDEDDYSRTTSFNSTKYEGSADGVTYDDSELSTFTQASHPYTSVTTRIVLDTLSTARFEGSGDAADDEEGTGSGYVSGQKVATVVPSMENHDEVTVTMHNTTKFDGSGSDFSDDEDEYYKKTTSTITSAPYEGSGGGSGDTSDDYSEGSGDVTDDYGEGSGNTSASTRSTTT